MKNLTRKKALEWILKFRNRVNSGGFCLECGREYWVCHDFADTGDNSCGKADYGKNYLSEEDYECSDITGATEFLKYVFQITEKEIKDALHAKDGGKE